MGFIKFTNTETGQVYDSREPVGYRVQGRTQKAENTGNGSTVMIEQPPLEHEPIYRHPKGKEDWICDPQWWIATEKWPPQDIFDEWPKEVQNDVSSYLENRGIVKYCNDTQEP